MLEETSDLVTAQRWADEILGDKNSAKYFMADDNLVAAYRNKESFSFVIKNEHFYGQLYGPNAYFDERCTSIAIAGEPLESFRDFERGGSSQFWEVATHESETNLELVDDAEEINAIIDEHAPDSSVRPGDSEEVFWGGVRNELGELAALAALVKWQSGLHVMVSVVTRAQDRGKGLATQLSLGMSARAHSLGISEIGLGVRAGNFAAMRVYEKTGFKKLTDFTRYSRE